MAYRIAVDIGGTFTDAVLADSEGRVYVGKAPTTFAQAFGGIGAAIDVIGSQLGRTREEVLAETELFTYSTTRGTNAIIERTTATTALLVTEGFPDVLVFREGGKTSPFDFHQRYPEPYVPRRLTFEVTERIDSEGQVLTKLDEPALVETLQRLRSLGVEAIAVSLLWSIVNPVHEARVGELVREHLPGVPYTLSHELSPIIREYRRASAAAIDASLKPLMAAHLRELRRDLADAAFRGELLGATLLGGVMHLDDLVARPIYSCGSGPAMAPIAGRALAASRLGAQDVVVCDMGGTSFDVSLIVDGAIDLTRETWLGGRFVGHLVATSSVNVHSIGAGGGSIAWIDAGGLLRVGPQSAGADPGPACYGRGGTQPTVTDAALVLGYLHPDEFLGGRMRLDADAARATVATIGDALGQTVEQAASAILSVANAHMVAAIREVTIDRGVDPRDCLIVAGGGAAGLAISEIARELGCRRVLVPLMAGTLSAVGAHHSSIVMEFTATLVTDTARFDHAGVQRTLGELNAQAERFSDELRARGVDAIRQEYSVDARYQHQVWDLEIGLGDATIGSAEDVALLCERFDAAHLAMFSVNDPGQVVETSTWRVRIVGEVAEPRPAPADDGRPGRDAAVAARTGYFPGLGWIEVPLHRSAQLQPGQRIDGPAIVATSTSTLVAHPGDAIVVTEGNDFLLEVAPA